MGIVDFSGRRSERRRKEKHGDDVEKFLRCLAEISLERLTTFIINDNKLKEFVVMQVYNHQMSVDKTNFNRVFKIKLSS
jgi:hypothetical protein